MNEQKIREAMAALEGYFCNEDLDCWFHEYEKGISYFCDTHSRHLRNQLPAYDSHDDVQRVIDGLDDCSFYQYGEALYKITEEDCSVDWACYNTLKATPAQKCEAVLRAKGLWED